MNPYRGEIEIQLNDKPAILVYDWNAIAAIQAEFGELNDQLIKEIQTDLKAAARVVAIGLRRHNPDITVDKIMASTLPIFPTIRDAIRSINTVLTGMTDPAAAERPQKAGGEKIAQSADNTQTQ